MPIYEYLCKKCGEFEVTQRITEKPLAKCPTCRGKVTKLISSTSFQLKGSGWYITDYGRGGSKAGEPKAGESSEPKAEGSASAKPADDKPSETKSSTKSTESKSASSKSSTSKSSAKTTKAGSTPAAAA